MTTDDFQATHDRAIYARLYRSTDLPSDLSSRLDQLEGILKEMGSVAIGFSGGVDSSLVALVASRVLGDRALAVTIRSPVESPDETEQAIHIAHQAGIRHQVVDMDDLADPVFAANPTDRCYHCKLRRFNSLNEIARKEGLAWLADGTNADDVNFYRPGTRALSQIGVRSPLAEAGLTKSDIRKLSQLLNLPNWDKPASPCLATRFPYNTRLTQASIQRVGQAESYLRGLGFRQVRVRVHPQTVDQEGSQKIHAHELARIEVDIQSFPALLSRRDEITAHLRGLGYAYITLDLVGFRSGSMDENLNINLNGSP